MVVLSQDRRIIVDTPIVILKKSADGKATVFAYVADSKQKYVEMADYANMESAIDEFENLIMFNHPFELM